MVPRDELCDVRRAHGHEVVLVVVEGVVATGADHPGLLA
jgi:hypothetical protein